MEQWQPVFHSDMTLAGADRLIKRIGAGRGPEQRTITVTESLNTGIRQRRLANRPQGEPLFIPGRALAHGVEAAHRFQLVPEEIEPQRLLLARREEIGDPAPDCILAGLAHGSGPMISVMDQEIVQPLLADILANSGRQGCFGKQLARRQSLQYRAYGSQHHGAALFAASQARQRIQPRGDNLRIRGDAVIGQTIPGRYRYHR